MRPDPSIQPLRGPGIGAFIDQILQLNGRKIVAVDGVDGAGKTTFSDQLAELIRQTGKTVVRASIDGFHNPRALRYRKGKDDPSGYFLDSYNYADFHNQLVVPFREGATTVHLARFDHRTDQANPVISFIPQEAILLIDGIFLHRNEPHSLWDFSVFLNVPFVETFRRMSLRDGCDPNPLADSNRRYNQGQLMYLEICKPNQRASVVVNIE